MVPKSPNNGPGKNPDAIAARAYELFVARGGGHGHDLEDWLQAESEVSPQPKKRTTLPPQKKKPL